MEIGKTLYVATRSEWRKWLEQNFNEATEIWLILPKKSTGKPHIPYNDSVEVALCFGWIDSTIKRINEHTNAQRFTPRKPTSKFSQTNKERLRWLLNAGLLHKSVVQKVKEVLLEPFVFPNDILEVIKHDKIAWENYQQFSPAYQRIRIAYIDSARNRPEEFRKRLTHFIKKSRANKQIGYGGIEKYF